MATFHFKHFKINQDNASMKVGTDAMILGALVNATTSKRALDIGAGTGILSLMIAQKNPNTEIVAIELDSESVLDCQLNFDQSQWKSRLKIVNEDFLTFQDSEAFDLIVSNPPFYQDSLHNPNERKANARHSFFLPTHLLLKGIKNLLKPGGSAWIIFPSNDYELLKELVEKAGLFIRIDYSVNGKPGTLVRKVFCLQNEPVTHEKIEILTIRNSDGHYSEQYKELTKEFHAKEL